MPIIYKQQTCLHYGPGNGHPDPYGTPPRSSTNVPPEFTDGRDRFITGPGPSKGRANGSDIRAVRYVLVEGLYQGYTFTHKIYPYLLGPSRDLTLTRLISHF